MTRFILSLLVLLTAVAMGGTGDDLAPSSKLSAKLVDERISRMLDRISRKECTSDQEQLHTIFKKTQKEFLRRYRQYSNPDDLAAGEFDCLTATSLFAEILQRAGFRFRIVETNYHIFLIVATSGGDVLIETTDRFDGFVTSAGEIARRIEQYRSESPSPSLAKTVFHFEFQLLNEVSQQQLSGLLFFNQAVKAYNENDWLLCSQKILLAGQHYATPRIAALASVLLCTVSLSDVAEEEKLQVINNLRQLQGAGPLASR